MSVSLSLSLLYLFQLVISGGQLLRPLVLSLTIQRLLPELEYLDQLPAAVELKVVFEVPEVRQGRSRGASLEARPLQGLSEGFTDRRMV